MDKKQLSFQFNNNHVRNYTVGTPFVPCLPRQGKDIVFRFIIEYSSSLMDFGS
jgi:hypothetical protein